MEVKKFCIDSIYEGERIDKFLTLALEGFSRSYIQSLIAEHLVTVNGKHIKANYKVALDNEIEVSIPKPKPLDIIPENIPLDIVYEDDSLIVINKPKGMVVHPSAGHSSGTLVNALLFYYGNRLSSINGFLRPGIVHRIDMDTTGLLVVCKTDAAHRNLANQLAAHSITRKYHAICYGHFSEEGGKVDKPIGRHPIERKKMAINESSGREAVTHYRVIKSLKNNYSYIECTLETGRTHQIRVHMASIGHPILGDAVYGPKNPKIKNLTGQTLHAKILGFIHPVTGQYMEFDSVLPEYFLGLLKNMS